MRRVTGGTAILGAGSPDREAVPIVGYSPANPPEHLGDPGFLSDHSVRYPYIAGAMANGIGSADIVEAMGRADMLGFFGAAGLPLEAIEAAIDRLSHSLEGRPYGFNLIHSPNEPDLESAVADLYIRRGVHLASASAYLDLTLPVVRYRVHGIHEDSHGRIVTPNRLIAKVSRLEVATKFFSPPPERLLKSLVDTGDITEEQARLAKRIPVAQDLTAEADSGGHTDNQSALALIPSLMAPPGSDSGTSWVHSNPAGWVPPEASPRLFRLLQPFPWGPPTSLPAQSTRPASKQARPISSARCSPRPSRPT